jgi:predicted neutral ceramidase superfamily lipid hydrolase
MYILTLNFSNQVLIIGFHLGFLETSLHWNKDMSVDNFIADVIIWAASTSINLKFHSFIEINYLEIIHCCWLFFSYKFICCAQASTKQHISYCIHPTQKGHSLSIFSFIIFNGKVLQCFSNSLEFSEGLSPLIIILVFYILWVFPSI